MKHNKLMGEMNMMCCCCCCMNLKVNMDLFSYVL